MSILLPDLSTKFRNSLKCMNLSQYINASPVLTIRVPFTAAADGIHKYFFIVFFQEIRLDISCESSVQQYSHETSSLIFFER